MLGRPVEAGPGSDGGHTADGRINAVEFELSDQFGAICQILGVKGQAEAAAAHIRHVLWVLTSQFFNVALEIVARFDGMVDQTLSENDIVLRGGDQSSDGVAHPGVELAEGNLLF